VVRPEVLPGQHRDLNRHEARCDRESGFLQECRSVVVLREKRLELCAESRVTGALSCKESRAILALSRGRLMVKLLESRPALSLHREL
jgi:hypothetical protein